jgi:SAM-dependent methyltransferase
MSADLAGFAAAYARHRAAEGRGHSGEALMALPYLRGGPLARQWAVRARSFEVLVGDVVTPLAKRLGRPLSVLDLGAGNGWLSWRLALAGHSAIALDIREDEVDGLGAARALASGAEGRMQLRPGSFDAIPAPDGSVDLAVFNASLHYALDLPAVLAEAARVVRPGGRLAIVDSPFYRREADGLAMVAEKKAGAAQRFGEGADVLLAPPFIEFLTRARLAEASAASGLAWRRRRVLYPLWYEARPLLARLRGARPPSRFDVWVSARP